MPFVFVHGVGVRQGDSDAEKRVYAQNETTRNQLFRTIAFAGLPQLSLDTPLSPYWGRHGATFSHDLISIPASGVEAFGSPEQEALAQGLRETVPLNAASSISKSPVQEPPVLLTVARETSLIEAVDVLAVASASVPPNENGDANEQKADSENRANFLAAAQRYARNTPHPAWLEEHSVTGYLVADDDQFLARLAQDLPVAAPAPGGGQEAFGIGDALQSLGRVAGQIGDIAKKTLTGVVAAVGGAVAGAAIVVAPGAVTRTVRPTVTRLGGAFFGDVFVYLKERDKAGSGGILDDVRDALRQAAKDRTDDDPLIVVAHSMGGNIVYDILTSYLDADNPEDDAVFVDVFVTVGSQVSLFKELSLYKEDAQTIAAGAAGAKTPKPARVGTWLNIFDPMDALGFACEGVFDGVKDYALDNRASPFTTHSLYFSQPAFHERLRARLSENGLGSAPT